MRSRELITTKDRGALVNGALWTVIACMIVVLTMACDSSVYNYERDEYTDTLLDAVVAGDQQEVKSILEQGANPNAVAMREDGAFARFFDNSPDEETTIYPLMLAVRFGDETIIRQIVDAGADVTLRPETTTVETEPSSGTPPLVELAIKAESEEIASLVFLLVENGADPNGTDSNGNTALSFLGEYPSVIEELITHGADVNLANKDGLSPLMLASSKYPQSVEVLLDAGADPNATSSEVSSPMLAASARHTDSLVALINAGADASFSGRGGFTALHLAVGGSRSDASADLLMANELIQAGADVDAVTEDGLTPLTLAVNSGHPAVVQLLLDSGADVDAGAAGSRPIEIAQDANNWTLYDLLIDHGASRPDRYWTIRVDAGGVTTQFTYDSQTKDIVGVSDSYNEFVGETAVRQAGFSLEYGDFYSEGTRVLQEYDGGWTVFNLYTGARNRAVINTNYGDSQGTWTVVDKSMSYR